MVHGSPGPVLPATIPTAAVAEPHGGLLDPLHTRAQGLPSGLWLPPRVAAAPQLPTWPRVMDDYLEHARAERRVCEGSCTTGRGFLRAWDRYISSVGTTWHAAGPADLAGFGTRRRLRDGSPLAANTHLHGYRTVRRFYRWAAEVGLLPADPMRLVRPPRTTPLPSRGLTHEQVAEVLRATTSTCGTCTRTPAGTCRHRRRWALAAHLAYYAGLRAMEIGGLHWEDVHLTGPDPALIVRDGKGGRPGRVALAGPLAAVLAAHRPAGHATGPVVSPTMDPGDPHALRPAAVGHLLARVMCHADVPGSGHDLRHALAMHLEEAGVPLLDIMRILRHERLTTTQRYLQGVRDRSAAALARLGDRLAGELG